MGYRHFKNKCVFPVKCENGNIVIQFPTGEFRYKTNLKINTEYQVINHDIPKVLFVLSSGDVQYFGRENGTISGYRTSDNLLVALGTWTSPKPPMRQEIGSMGLHSYSSGYIDKNLDFRIVFFTGEKDVFVLKEPAPDKTDMPSAIGESFTSGARSFKIYDEYGGKLDEKEIGHWYIPVRATGSVDTGLF